MFAIASSVKSQMNRKTMTPVVRKNTTQHIHNTKLKTIISHKQTRK